MTFPKGFLWGAASSAFQIEGAAQTDGKGLSVWDTFCRLPGRVFGGHPGDVACDHYHRWREDVALMQELGLGAYRFSLSWPRILPAGTGAVNEAGLGFYDRLIDALLAAKITPCVTLFHWDLPVAVHHRGGWLNRDSADWFAGYAELVGRRYGDRVRHWITMNEPTIHLLYGYKDGCMAPGLQLGFGDLLLAVHHHLLAHGKAVLALRATCAKPPRVGLTHACAPSVPATNSAADVAAARARTFTMPPGTDTEGLHASSWWQDPIYLGEYPAEACRQWAPYLPEFPASDLAIIHAPVDFCGLNIYHSHRTRAGAAGPEYVPWEEDRPRTTMNWPVTPEALYWGPRFFHERYGKPIYILESGMANTDCVSLDGHVHDPQRIDYHARYLQALGQAGADGVPLGGYFAWAIMDVHEWQAGYSQRFGLVHVNRQTLARTPKDSFHWYRQVIATNGAALGSAAGGEHHG